MSETVHTKAYRLPLQLLLLMVIVCLAYAPAYPGAFLWDDHSLIVENPLVTSSDGLQAIWLSTRANDYYPITYSAYWMIWYFFPDSPSAFLIFNLSLHYLTVVALFFLARSVTPKLSLYLALLFAIHPLSTFSACWVSEIKNTGCALFFFLSALCYIHGITKEKPWAYYCSALSLFILSLLTKPAGVMLPFILLLFLHWKNRITIRNILLTAPFFICSLIAGSTTIWFQTNRALHHSVPLTASYVERFIIAGKSLWFYTWLTFNPAEIAVFYPKWQFTLPMISIIPAIAFTLATLTALILFCRRKVKTISFGVLFYAITIFPVLGFINQGHYEFSFVANHWMYIPLVGLLTSFLGLLFTLPKKLAICIVWVAVCISLLLSRQQATIFASQEDYYRQALTDYPKSVIANHNLANILFEQQDFKDAITYYQAALDSEFGLWDAHNKIAASYLHLGMPEKALLHAKSSLGIDQQNPEALCILGEAYGKRGNYDLSISAYLQALEYRPDDETVYGNLGVSYFGKKDLKRSYECLKKAVTINPSYGFARKNLDILLRTNPELGHRHK